MNSRALSGAAPPDRLTALQAEHDRLRAEIAAKDAENGVLRDRISSLEVALTMPDADRRQWALADLIARQGYFNRSDLCAMFEISVPQASADIQRFIGNHPHVAIYNKSSKRYERAALATREPRAATKDSSNDR